MIRMAYRPAIKADAGLPGDGVRVRKRGQPTDQDAAMARAHLSKMRTRCFTFDVPLARLMGAADEANFRLLAYLCARRGIVESGYEPRPGRAYKLVLVAHPLRMYAVRPLIPHLVESVAMALDADSGMLVVDDKLRVTTDAAEVRVLMVHVVEVTV